MLFFTIGGQFDKQLQLLITVVASHSIQLSCAFMFWTNMHFTGNKTTLEVVITPIWLQIEAGSHTTSTADMCMQPLLEYISIHCHDNGTVGNFYTVKQRLIHQSEGRSNEWRSCSVAVLDVGE